MFAVIPGREEGNLHDKISKALLEILHKCKSVDEICADNENYISINEQTYHLEISSDGVFKLTEVNNDDCEYVDNPEVINGTIFIHVSIK